MVQLLQIVPSHLATKKFDAHFITDTGDSKVVPFGAVGYSDYTIHKDPERQRRYIARHAHEDWSSPMSAGTLSRYVLWSSPSLKQGINNYIQKFRL